MHSDMLFCHDEVWRFLLRLIMNFVPQNLYQRTLTGDISALPTGFQWSCLTLMAEEMFLMSARDRRCFFYIFSLPSSWRPYMAFNIEVPLEWFEAGATGQCMLASAVVLMRWRSAVAVCQ